MSNSKYDRLNSLYSKYDLASTGPIYTALETNRTNRSMFGRDNKYDFLRNTGTRSWHPSPYVSDVSDEEADGEYEPDLSVEEKTAKVRAEIKRRRQRLADSDRLYRHYSFEDYNILNNERDPLDSFNYLVSQSDTYDKYLTSNDYSLIESKEKYFSDELVEFSFII